MKNRHEPDYNPHGPPDQIKREIPESAAAFTIADKNEAKQKDGERRQMKKPSNRANGFLEDYSEWMGSREGLESMEAMDTVFNALDGARVDSYDRKIIGRMIKL